MAVKIRLTRVGSKKNPIYRVVVADSRSPRDGRSSRSSGATTRRPTRRRSSSTRRRSRTGSRKGAQPTDAVVAAASRPQGIDAEHVAELARVARAAARRRPGRRARRDARSATDAIVLHLHVAPDDVGKVIGRQGRIARALRTIVRAGGARERTSASCSRLSTDAEPSSFAVGRVGRPHGLDGSFVVEDASEDPSAVRGRRASCSSAASPRRSSLSKQVGGRPRRSGSTAAVERGAELPCAATSSAAARRRTRTTSSELVGLEVEEEGGARARRRRATSLPGPANDVLELDSGLLLPLVEACVREVDLDGRRILVAPGFAD